MQDEILKGMEQKLAGKAEVRYIMTTRPDDRSAFFQYGIRSLPAMIIVDAAGKETKRFAPGIQQQHTILEAL
jgi:thioredoxin 1